MESPLDLALAALLFAGAAAFTAWRMLASKQPPACAPDLKAAPQVVVGARLAKGLANVRKEHSSPTGSK